MPLPDRVTAKASQLGPLGCAGDRFRHHNLSCPEYFPFPEISLLNFAGHGSLWILAAGFCVDGLVERWIKFLTYAVEGHHTALLQELMDLSLDRTHALIDLRFGFQGFRLERTIEAVLHCDKP